MYDLELDKVVSEIKKQGAKQVLIQLPDGLKNQADKVIDKIEKETSAQAFLWFGSCFGACDLPLGLSNLKIDLAIQFGHNRYWKTKEW